MFKYRGCLYGNGLYVCARACAWIRPGLPKHTVLYIIVYVRVCTTVLIRVHPTGKRENTSSRIIGENCSRLKSHNSQCLEFC